MIRLSDIEGVFTNGVHCGIKADPSKKDLGFLFVPNAVGSAGVFTRNQIVSPTVTYTKKQMNRHTLKAVVVNSGNANAATGVQGMRDVKSTAKQAADLLGVNAFEVAVASTGIIGEPMPMNHVIEGLDVLLTSSDRVDSEAFADAILTTDLTRKEACVQGKVGKKTVTIAGVTKGSGMIAPNMATTLSFLVTDLALTNEQLSPFLQQAVDDTFNMLSVDTDTSTNDMVLIFSTGKYKFSVQNESERQQFQELLNEVCEALVVKLAQDGEGADHVIVAEVLNAASKSDARRIAKSVVDSPLIKTAVHGSDPNWGRILMAVGKVLGVKLNEKKLGIAINAQKIFEAGQPLVFDRDDLREKMKEECVVLTIDLGLGHSHAKAWGCDLSARYVDINTAYN